MILLIKSAIAAFFYLILTIFVLREPLIQNIGSIQWDAVSVHFYNLFFSSELASRGILPLWTPYIFGGFPQIADLQVAFFYPINYFISFISVFTPETLMFQVAFHYFLAGVFAFLLARYLSKNFLFALAAGMIYAFGGFMIGHASHVGMQNTATWLPLIFLMTTLALEKERLVYAAFGGLFMGIAILAGHFQMSLYVAYFIAFYSAFIIFWALLSKNSVNENKNFFLSIFKKIGLVVVFYSIAFLVSAIQLLSTYELVQETNRAAITLEMSQTESLEPKSLRALIEPNFNNAAYDTPYTGPWDRTQNYLFVGNVILIMAFLGVFIGLYSRATRKMTAFFTITLLIVLFYSFGKYGPLQKYFYLYAPFFDKIRAPANMMLLFNLTVIGLASSLFSFINSYFAKISEPITLNSLPSFEDLPYLFKKTFIRYSSLFIGFAAFAVLTVNILPAALGPNTLLYSSKMPAEITAAPPFAEKISAEYQGLSDINKFRVFKIPGLDQNSSQIFHILAFDGYNPLSLKRYNNFVDEMVKNEKLVDIAAIKYLPCEFIRRRTNNLQKIDSICVNNSYFPLAFLTDDFIVTKNDTEALSKIKEVNLEKTTVLEESISAKKLTNTSPQNTAESRINNLTLIESRPGYWNFSTKTDNDMLLFVSQANYPGWRAEIDRRLVKIYQANYLFQAILVPKGEHNIILSFQSKALNNGAILTIIGLFAVFFMMIYDLCKKQLIVKKDWAQTIREGDKKIRAK